MDIKAFYARRHGDGVIGRIARVLVWWHQHVRPPHPFPGRNQGTRVYRQYVHMGRTLALGSNLPPDELTEFHGVVQVDLKPLRYVDRVLDAECMSSAFSEPFDFVMSTSMLEHTPHPWRVLEESFKVLKPGGVLYVAVPWIYPLHGEPHDYFRFSLPGLRHLLQDAGFEELEYGSECSPHAALYSFLLAYFPEVLSFGNAYAYYALEYVFAWLLWPIGVIERVFRLGSRRHHYTDSIVYVVARRPFTACGRTEQEVPSQLEM